MIQPRLKPKNIHRNGWLMRSAWTPERYYGNIDRAFLMYFEAMVGVKYNRMDLDRCMSFTFWFLSLAMNARKQLPRKEKVDLYQAISLIESPDMGKPLESPSVCAHNIMISFNEKEMTKDFILDMAYFLHSVIDNTKSYKGRSKNVIKDFLMHTYGISIHRFYQSKSKTKVEDSKKLRSITCLLCDADISNPKDKHSKCLKICNFQ